MASSIGLRVYRIAITKKKSQKLIGLADEGLKTSFGKVLDDFVKLNMSVVKNDEAERSWYFVPRLANASGQFKGYLHYGTFGFASNFVDNATKKHTYRRKVTDTEEIPLFYEFWLPAGQKFALVAFQSFQGRSCIGLVLNDLKKQFESANKEINLQFKKLLPSGSAGNLYSHAPVKKLSLIKHNAPSDIADRYFGKVSRDTITFEVSISARRNRNLGNWNALSSSVMENAEGTVLFDGIEFDEAIAEINVGGKLRRVGVFGSDSEAGVIDITADITRGLDGHPTFQSLEAQSKAVLKDFYKSLKDCDE